jgi:hypothetical protein
MVMVAMLVWGLMMVMTLPAGVYHAADHLHPRGRYSEPHPGTYNPSHLRCGFELISRYARACVHTTSTSAKTYAHGLSNTSL